MRTVFGTVGAIVAAAILIVLYLSFFIVDVRQQALVLRFGNPVRVVTEPGLAFKVPLIDNVVYIDKRVLDLDSPPLEVIASDQKRLVVDAFGRFRIVDPLLFYQAVGTVDVAETRLSSVLNSSVRRVLGEVTFQALVRDQRAALMDRITQQVNGEARRFGISVVDVKIRRADLPAQNSQAIFQRMQTERQREATEIRAEGEEAARTIRAQADRQATVIVAEANRQADGLRGDGESQRNTIFAEAFSQDPDFFAFYRSMEAYSKGIGTAKTRLVISPKSEFFRYFDNPAGGAAALDRPATTSQVPARAAAGAGSPAPAEAPSPPEASPAPAAPAPAEAPPAEPAPVAPPAEGQAVPAPAQ